VDDLIAVLVNNFDRFLDGFLVTCQLVVAGFFTAVIVGTIVGSMRVIPIKPLNWIGALYVEWFRNVPLLVLCIIFFAGLRRSGAAITEWQAGTAALGLYTAAYVSEALRSGVYAVNKGQIEASLSLGFTYPQTLRRVVMPQAFRTVVPPLGSIVIAMIKNSAIVGGSLIALPDMLQIGRRVQNDNAQTLETFFWVGVGYLILTVSATVVVRRLEKRLAIRR
jgi:His/Glu/Gln/Arg/opine family amino acid ABC transporter permease subunit